MPGIRLVASASVLLFLMAAIAGCSGGGDASSSFGPAGTNSGSGTAVPPGGSGSLDAPAPLRVGDWWNYTVGTGSTWTYVVSAVGPADYTMETDSPSLAFFNARSDVSTLGPIRVADLAGSQGETRVEFLKWPLVEGKNWTTTWDGVPVTVRVHLASPTVAQMTATTANGTAHATYTYDRAVKWFTEIDFKDDKGQSAFGMKLARHGANFTGTIARWTLDPVVTMAGDFSQPEQPSQFDVPLTATDVWVRYSFSCTTGVASLGAAPMPIAPAIAGTDTRGAGEFGQQCPAAASFSGSAGAPQAPPQGGGAESWGATVVGGPQVAGPYEMEVLVRTLARVPLAAAA